MNKSELDKAAAQILEEWIINFKEKKHNIWNETKTGKIIKSFVYGRGNWKGQDKKLKEIKKVIKPEVKLKVHDEDFFG